MGSHFLTKLYVWILVDVQAEDDLDMIYIIYYSIIQLFIY